MKINTRKIENIVKLEIIVIIQVNIGVLRIAHVISHNGSNYDYHFIMKELAEEFKKQFTCLRESSE